MDINTNNLAVDQSGRVTLSGVSSKIDSKTAVDQIIAAKRIPIDRIEAQVDKAKEKAQALKDMRTLMGTLKDSLSNIRGAVSVGGTSDSFKAKQAFTSTSRTDGLTPSAAPNLAGITVTNAAALGTREIEVLRVAKAHKVGSAAFTSLTADLGTARGTGAGSVAGTFDIAGKTITVQATDTLLDLRDRINNANSGATPSGVTASVVSVGTSEHYLVLTNDKTGVAMTINNETGAVLSELGISANGGTTFSNLLQSPETARLKADGLIDPDRMESKLLTAGTPPLSSIASATFPGSFVINGTASATINYTGTDTIASLAAAINVETGTTGVTASIMQDGNGLRLVLTRAGGAAFTITDTNGLMSGLGLDNLQVIERTSNTINDLYSGVTISIYQAEEDTKIKIDVDRNLTSIKGQMTAFIEAYNAVKQAINTHQYVDPGTGLTTDATGVLFGNKAIADVESSLANLIGGGVQGVNAKFSVLAQIGVNFVDNRTLDDPTLESTLTLDEAKLDEALLNNPEDVRRLFSFDFTASDSRFVMLNYTGSTAYNAAGYTLNVGNVGASDISSRQITSQTATLDNASSYAATISGSFQINGTAIAYNVAADTLDTLVTAINAAAITGVSASVSGGKLKLASTTNPLAVTADTGNLVAAMNLVTDDYLIGRANIGGAADGTSNGTLNVSKRNLTATSSTGANGLQVFYTGNTDVSGVTLNFTVGFGAQMFHAIDSMLKPVTGVIEAEIAGLEDETELNEDRIADMEARLDIQRTTLTDKFLAMEAALARMNSLLDSIEQISLSMQPRR